VLVCQLTSSFILLSLLQNIKKDELKWIYSWQRGKKEERKKERKDEEKKRMVAVYI
jgi:hypothetical protein